MMAYPVLVATLRKVSRDARLRPNTGERVNPT